MRLVVPVVMLVLLSTLASAYTLSSTGAQGTQPVLYGDFAAFLTLEDSADKDLNGDNDTSDRVIQYYNLRTEKTRSTAHEGKNPALFGGLLVFEDNVRMLWQYDLDANELNETKARGSSPSVFGTKVAIATAEQDVGLDLDSDGDTNDKVIRVLNADTGVVSSTRAAGDKQVMLKDYVVFETSESAANSDLNKDNDKDDSIIRYLDLDTEQVINTRITGSNPVGFKDTAIISSGSEFLLLDLVTTTTKSLGIFGNEPSLYNDLLAYERDGKLFVYRLSTGMEKALDIAGKDPSIFEGDIAFIDSDRNISILHGDDPDQDSIPDFADNCPGENNADQADADQDGIGDACDKTQDAVQNATATNATTAAKQVTAKTTANQTVQPPQEPARALPADRTALPEPVPEKPKKEDKGATFWFVVAVGLLGIGLLLYFVLPGWLNKRKKSYGF